MLWLCTAFRQIGLIMTAKPQVVIYTDGACSPNPGVGGWAAILVSPKHSKEKVLSGSDLQSTNNRMDLKH